MESPQTLDAIYGMNPAAFIQAQPMLDRQATAADIGNQQAQQTLDFGAQDQPFRLAQLGLNNQMTQAQIPGVQAQSNITARTDSNQATTNDAQVKDTMAKLQSDERQRHIQEISNLGPMFQQQAASVWSNPVGAAQRAKEALTQAGHPEMWNPAWDNLSPSDLGNALDGIGSSLTQTGQQYQLLHAQLEAKTERDSALEAQKQAGRMQLRQSINDNAQKIEAARDAEKDKLNKQTTEQYAVAMGREADRAEANGDVGTAATLRAKANQWLTESRAKAAASAGVTAATKPSLGAMAGIPTNPPSPAPAIGPVGPAAVPPQPAAPASAGRMGIKANSAQGQDWITQAMAHNPGMSVDDIIAEGKKSGRLTD